MLREISRFPLRSQCLFTHMFIRLCDRGAITSSRRSFDFRATCLPLRVREILLSLVPNGTTNELAGLFFTLSPLMLSVMQGSYKYQLLSHWFKPTLNRIPSLPFQKQTFYPLDHLSGYNFFFRYHFATFRASHHRQVRSDTKTIENAILLLK